MRQRLVNVKMPVQVSEKRDNSYMRLFNHIHFIARLDWTIYIYTYMDYRIKYLCSHILEQGTEHDCCHAETYATLPKLYLFNPLLSHTFPYPPDTVGRFEFGMFGVLPFYKNRAVVSSQRRLYPVSGSRSEPKLIQNSHGPKESQIVGKCFFFSLTFIFSCGCIYIFIFQIYDD